MPYFRRILIAISKVSHGNKQTKQNKKHFSWICGNLTNHFLSMSATHSTSREWFMFHKQKKKGIFFSAHKNLILNKIYLSTHVKMKVLNSCARIMHWNVLLAYLTSCINTTTKELKAILNISLLISVHTYFIMSRNTF